MTDFVKRIQSKLTKDSIKASRSEISQVIKSLGFDINNVTDEEITRIIAEFAKQNSMINTETNQESLMITPSEIPQPQALTVSKKQSITLTQAQEIGVTLNVQELTYICEMVAEDISSQDEYCAAVTEILSNYLAARNRKAAVKVDEEVNTITQLLNQRNDELADIYKDANSRLHDLVAECRARTEDYKSTRERSLKSFREVLGLSE